MTITEFLTARYDEAEALWSEAAERGLLLQVPGSPEVWADAGLPRQVLADIAAKRRLVELCATWMAAGERVADGRDMPALLVRTEAITAETVLRAVAQPYAEHRDFDPAWRV